MPGLNGTYYVYPTMTAITRAWKLCKGSVREYQKLRRQALTLANFPNCGDWDWIKALPRARIGELRIDEEIAGRSNIRVIFFKANLTLSSDPMPRIWTMTTFAKKSNDFSAGEIKAFSAMKSLIVLRHYDGNTAA